MVAIKNFDDETYRLVKTYASLEGRTITSIFEEAIRLWMVNRKDYEEVRLWVKLEQAYEENLKAFKDNSQILKEYGKGYAVMCDGRLIGVFDSYEDAIKNSKKNCRIHALIIKLPYEKRGERIELGLPW